MFSKVKGGVAVSEKPEPPWESANALKRQKKEVAMPI
jgi:hypothetical protein